MGMCVALFVAEREQKEPLYQSLLGHKHKCLVLERVKGIEPSYSAWKAAALPLSYTRARPINYHATEAASTAMRRFGANRPLFRQRADAPGAPLNMRRFSAYTDVSINNERR